VRKYLRALVAICVSVGAVLTALFFLVGFAIDMMELALLCLWAVGTLTGVVIYRGKGLRSVLLGAVGGLASVAAYVVFAITGQGAHWYGVLIAAGLLAGLSVVGSLTVGCIMTSAMDGVTICRTRGAQTKRLVTRTLQPTCYPYDYSTVTEDGVLLDCSSRYCVARTRLNSALPR